MDEFLGTEDGPKAQGPTSPSMTPVASAPFQGGNIHRAPTLSPVTTAVPSIQPKPRWQVVLGRPRPGGSGPRSGLWEEGGVTALETPGPWGTGG